MDLSAIKQLAEDLNYEGQDLRNFVDKQMQLYEDKLNRSSEKDERDERMKQREQVLRERELQAREKERELQARENEREHEIKLKELELKMKDNKNENNGEETKQGKVNSFTRVPKLPNFNLEHDDLPVYISRFELTASQNKWNEEEKFMGLSNLLTGECLQVLHSLQDKTYITLKDALFKRYKYTEEGFHERFRKTCPKDEDFSNYVNRLVALKMEKILAIM